MMNFSPFLDEWLYSPEIAQLIDALRGLFA